MGNHPECETYEEALKEELRFGCEVDVGFPSPHYATVIRVLKSNKYSICNHIRNTKYEGMQSIIEYNSNFTVERTPIKEITKILGLPITLGRVMVAFYRSIDSVKFSELKIFPGYDSDCCKLCLRNLTPIVWLLQKNGREATLGDQSKETISKLLSLFEEV